MVVTYKNKVYPEEIKYMAICDYLDGNGSLKHICTKYKISTLSNRQQWIKKYDSYKTFKFHSNQGQRTMTKERTEIVAFCYETTVHKSKISYQQVYTLVRKYEANGY